LFQFSISIHFGFRSLTSQYSPWLKKRLVDALLFIYRQLLLSVVVLARCRRYKVLVLTYAVLAAESPRSYGTVLVSIQSILIAKMCVIYQKILLFILHLMVKTYLSIFFHSRVIVKTVGLTAVALDYGAKTQSCSRAGILQYIGSQSNE
jgi:hypothetical protein